MKLESEKFLIVKKIKIFIYQLNTIVSLFPNRDYVGKNKIVEDSFLLLSDIYLINFSDKSDNLKKANVLTKINMLDFYLERAYKLKYISEKQCLKLSSLLLEINNMVTSWLWNDKIKG